MPLPDDRELAFPPPEEWRRAWWLRACTVSTLDGSVIGSDGHSGSISSAVDREVFLRLRRDCDVILMGAGTLRAEDCSRTSVPTAILSGRLDLSPDLRLFAAGGTAGHALVITTDVAAATAPAWLGERAEIVCAGTESVEPERALEELARRGLTRIHCEGGPRTLGTLAGPDLIDELVLTLTPDLLGTPERLLTAALPPRRWQTTGTWTHDGTTVIRTRRAPGPAEGTH